MSSGTELAHPTASTAALLCNATLDHPHVSGGELKKGHGQIVVAKLHGSCNHAGTMVFTGYLKEDGIDVGSGIYPSVYAKSAIRNIPDDDHQVACLPGAKYQAFGTVSWAGGSESRSTPLVGPLC